MVLMMHHVVQKRTAGEGERGSTCRRDGLAMRPLWGWLPGSRCVSGLVGSSGSAGEGPS